MEVWLSGWLFCACAVGRVRVYEILTRSLKLTIISTFTATTTRAGDYGLRHERESQVGQQLRRDHL
jgi:hypothetical protein